MLAELSKLFRAVRSDEGSNPSPSGAGDAHAQFHSRNSFPRFRARRSCDPERARARPPCAAASVRPGAPPCWRAVPDPPPAAGRGSRSTASPRSRVAADLLHRTIAAQAGQHDLDLLLRRPAPVLALLAQPHLLVGRAAHAEPAAGRYLRRYAPRGLSGAPSELPVNAGPGSGATRRGEGMRSINTPMRPRRANANAERFVRTVRAEVLTRC
jgi:hypothetical protein